MALPSSGPLHMSSINTELGFAYNATNSSLASRLSTAGFPSDPDQMSELYGYTNLEPTINFGTTVVITNTSLTRIIENTTIRNDIESGSVLTVRFRWESTFSVQGGGNIGFYFKKTSDGSYPPPTQTRYDDSGYIDVTNISTSEEVDCQIVIDVGAPATYTGTISIYSVTVTTGSVSYTISSPSSFTNQKVY